MKGLENRIQEHREVICQWNSPVWLKHGARAPGLLPAFARSDGPSTPWVKPQLPHGLRMHMGGTGQPLGSVLGEQFGQAGGGRELFLLYFLFLNGKSNRKFLRGAT